MTIFAGRSGLLNTAARFAGLGAGLKPGARGGSKKPEDKPESDAASADEDAAAGTRADDDGDDMKKPAEKGGKKPAGKAPANEEDEPDGDDDSENREGDDGDSRDQDEDGDDASDEDDMKRGGKGKSKAVRSARMRERSRIAAILGHESAQGREQAAAHLALTTSMSRSEAVGVLASLPKEAAAQTGRLASAMEAHRGVHAGAGAPALTPEDAAKAGWAAAMHKASASYAGR